MVCLAPRAPGESVRPRRPAGASVRPLNFTVRRPLRMPRHLIWRFSLGLCLLVQGCALPGSSGPSGANGTKRSQELLAVLKQCLAEVPSRSGEQEFVSPCVKRDVTILNGVTIAHLKSSLGAAGISSDDYVFVPKDKDALPPPFECRWAFYRLPSNVVLGGGPELQCVSSDRRTCEQVRWVRTE